ncbi:MAG TPA: SgcJ/EcaC family oxidoreductase [Rhizomicrobium sp.]
MDMKQSDEAAAVRAVVENWAAAVRRKDFPEILRHHSSDMLMFDLPPPLFSKGIDDYRATWDMFYAASPDPAVFNIEEMDVTAGSDVAFVTALMRCIVIEGGREGARLDFRLTVGLRKIAGQWTITHEHHSIPAAQ